MTWTPEKPLFVYGVLKPTEPAFRFVKDWVEISVEATLSEYTVSVRDGLPLIIENRNGTGCQGFLLYPKQETFQDFKDAVFMFEPCYLYTQTEVSVWNDSTTVPSVTNIGKDPNIGNAVEFDGTWSMLADPLLTNGLQVSAQVLASQISKLNPVPADADGYWEQMIPLEGTYLFLWTAIERLTNFLYGPVTKTGEKNYLLESEEVFRRVLHESNLEKLEVLNSKLEESESFLGSHYAVRNNLSHQGKNGFHDFDLLKSATGELQNFLMALWIQIPSLIEAIPQNLRVLLSEYHEHQRRRSELRRISQLAIAPTDI